MDSIYSKLNTRLKLSISDVDLSLLSRIPLDRYKHNSLVHIGLIELVSGEDFANLYTELYQRMFDADEREEANLIVTRLQQEFNDARRGLAPYRAIGIRDHDGQAIACAQFCVLFLPNTTFAVPYLQYIYTRPENRRQDMSELLHTLVLAVTTVNARDRSLQSGIALQVPFTFFETEPPCHGLDDARRVIAEQRSRIHTKSGSVALMLRRKRDGRLLSSHVQPGLGRPGDPPVVLIWALRANPAIRYDFDGSCVGEALLGAYYQSIRDEGFPEENIRVAETIVGARCAQDCDFCLIPLADITKQMYVDVD